MLILVVDDDPIAAELTGAIIEDLGHQVVLAEDGVDAMNKLNERTDIELIISDMNMPMISGLELFRELREQGCALPFMLLSGDDPQALQQQAPDLNACLSKDFTLADVLPEALAPYQRGAQAV